MMTAMPTIGESGQKNEEFLGLQRIKDQKDLGTVLKKLRYNVNYSLAYLAGVSFL